MEFRVSLRVFAVCFWQMGGRSTFYTAHPRFGLNNVGRHPRRAYCTVHSSDPQRFFSTPPQVGWPGALTRVAVRGDQLNVECVLMHTQRLKTEISAVAKLPVLQTDIAGIFRFFVVRFVCAAGTTGHAATPCPLNNHRSSQASRQHCSFCATGRIPLEAH